MVNNGTDHTIDDDPGRCARMVMASDGVHEMRCFLGKGHVSWCMIDSPTRLTPRSEDSQPPAGQATSLIRQHVGSAPTMPGVPGVLGPRTRSVESSTPDCPGLDAGVPPPVRGMEPP